MEIVINCKYGGYGLSEKAMELFIEKKEAGKDKGKYKLNKNGFDIYLSPEEERADPDLVSVVRELGQASWGRSARLKIFDVPHECNWDIEEIDGWEALRLWTR